MANDEQPASETILAYKGFTKDLTCTGGDKPFAYAVGETVFAGIAGRDGIKPGVWYELKDGKPVEAEE